MASLDDKERVWVETAPDTWSAGEVLSRNENVCLVQLETGEVRKKHTHMSMSRVRPLRPYLGLSARPHGHNHHGTVDRSPLESQNSDYQTSTGIQSAKFGGACD